MNDITHEQIIDSEYYHAILQEPLIDAMKAFSDEDIFFTMLTIIDHGKIWESTIIDYNLKGITTLLKGGLITCEPIITDHTMHQENIYRATALGERLTKVVLDAFYKPFDRLKLP